MEASLAAAIVSAVALVAVLRPPGWFMPELASPLPHERRIVPLRCDDEEREAAPRRAHVLAWTVAGTAVARLALWASLGA